MVGGFTGTRSGPTPPQHKSMRRFIGGMPLDRLVHGGAPGCDTFAHWIMRELHPKGLIHIYPATDSGSLRDGIEPLENTTIHPPAPPLDRDRTFVEQIDGLLAVPRTDQEGASGTWATVRYAREIGLPVYVIQQNGRIVRYVG